VAGYHNYGEGFCWSPDGGQLLYSHYDKLYRINRDGTHLTLLATAPEGRHFKACEWSGVARKIVVQTIGANINDSELYLMKEDGSEMSLIVDNMPGRIEYPSFSIDGKKLLFTQDKSGFTTATGRQLDACVFLLDMATLQTTGLSGQKPEGTNDTYPRFSPNGAFIIFENSSNEVGAPKSIWKMNLSGEDRHLLIEHAEFPDWG
jgi:TolB protein